MHRSPPRAGAFASPVVLSALATLLVPHVAHPQEVTVLAEDLCAACSIELTPDAVLGSDGESVVALANEIQRLADGRFVMAFDAAPNEFTVFSANGAEYRRVGRAGEGPGEYGHVLFVREHGDRLRVFDRASRRITVLDPADYEVVGTVPAMCWRCDAGDMATLPNGATVLNFARPAGGYEQYETLDELRAAARWRFIHILGEDGQPRVSMDGAPGDQLGTGFRHLDVAPDGSLLSAPALEYRIDRWDPEAGDHLGTFLRDADWWPEDSPAPPPGPAVRPPTTMEAMHMDEAGRLWVYVSRPTTDWRDHVERTGLSEHMGEWRYGPGATEWVVEVVDLEARKVVASQVVDVAPRPFARFFAPGWLAVYDDERIVPMYRMYRMRLVGLGGSSASAFSIQSDQMANRPALCPP